jgi:hypothetical protein
LFDIPFELIKKLTKTPKKSVDKLLSSYQCWLLRSTDPLTTSDIA